MWIFLGTTCLAFFLMFVIHASESLESIRLHWNEYRCHPAYIPFAGTIRPDVSTSENLYYCFGLMANQLYKPVLDSLNGLFGNVNASISEISEPLTLFRGLFTRVRKFMLSFTSTTFSKITNSTSALTTILIKIRDIVRRVIGEGYIGAFLINTGVDFVVSFIFMCMNIIKIFVYSLLAVSILLILGGQIELLILATTLLAMIGAAGFL